MRNVTYYLCEWHAAMHSVPVEYSSLSANKVETYKVDRLGYKGLDCQAYGCNKPSDFRVWAKLVPAVEYVAPASSYAPIDWDAREKRAAEAAAAAVRHERAEAEAEAAAAAIVGAGFLIGLAAVGAAKGAKAVHRKATGKKRR